MPGQSWAEVPRTGLSLTKIVTGSGLAALTINSISSFGFVWLQAVQKPKKGFPRADTFKKKTGGDWDKSCRLVPCFWDKGSLSWPAECSVLLVFMHGVTDVLVCNKTGSSKKEKSLHHWCKICLQSRRWAALSAGVIWLIRFINMLVSNTRFIWCCNLFAAQSQFV